ncbi:MAG: hypothetical protein GXX91_05565 [Verrucomicrobiaceae bacterium]|nr:hypothetical protein [Verrucomicrobiaceae bacterium]
MSFADEVGEVVLEEALAEAEAPALRAAVAFAGGGPPVSAAGSFAGFAPFPAPSGDSSSTMI